MTFYLYKDGQNYWRWRLISDNRKIIADSGEGYVNKADCLHGISLVKGSSTAQIVEV